MSLTKEEYLNSYESINNGYYKGSDVLNFKKLIDEHYEVVKKIEWLKEEMTEPVFNLVFGTQEFFHNWYQGVQIYSAENTILQIKLRDYENPQPLKFEELEEGMWVWDNKNHSWLKVIGFYGFNIHVQFGIGIYKNDCYVEYEENRFFRKQV